MSKLMEPYLDRGHHLYMDSYYVSPAIAEELAQRNTGVCGTVSSSRKGMPKSLSKDVLKLTKSDPPVFYRKGKMLVCAWYDTARVTVLSTLHGNDCVRNHSSSHKDPPISRHINRPVCVDKYTK